jgi:hypothetical protein
MATCPVSACARTWPCHSGSATAFHLTSTLSADQPPPASRRPRAPRHPSLSLSWPVDEARVHFATSRSHSALCHVPRLHTTPLQLPVMTTMPQATQGPLVSPISSPLSRCSVHKEIQPLQRAPRALCHLPHPPPCALRHQTLSAIPRHRQPSLQHQADREPLTVHFAGRHDPRSGPSPVA